MKWLLGIGVIVVVAVAAFVVTRPPSLPIETPRPATPTPTRSVSAAPSVSPSSSPSPSPTTPTSASGNVVVERPLSGARATSPITVSGKARAFEAAIAWRLVDVGGTELVRGFATASIGAPDFGTYSFPIPFRVTAETNAYVEVFTRSARDGSVTDLVRVPVTLLP